MPATQTFPLPADRRRPHGPAPWWLGYLLLVPPRRLLQSPRRILGPHVAAGQTVLEVGAGLGFFTLPMAAMVGATGRVIAADCQERLCDGLRRRLRRHPDGQRVTVRTCRPETLQAADLAGAVDLVVAFNVVHEAADPERMIGEMARCLRPGGRLLLSEPRGHVHRDRFLWQYGLCREVGLQVVDWPRHWRQMTVLLERAGNAAASADGTP